MSARALSAALRSATLAGALLALATPAIADPTVWDRAREPQLHREQQALEAAERLLLAGPPGLELMGVRGAVPLLELAAERAPLDPRVDFLLAELNATLADTPVERAELIVKHAVRALARAPRAPEAAVAWYRLALAAATSGDRAAEVERYSRVLELSWDMELRGNVLLNRAEAYVALGELALARADYRASLRLARRPDVQALALIGLAVALERSDDLPAAYVELDRLASLALPRSPLFSPGVFFVPHFELHYYVALESLGDARRARLPAARRTALSRALDAWDRYLAGARPARHLWLAHGERLRALTSRKLSALAR